MIPTEEQVDALWDKYRLPEPKRRHMALVAKVARFLGRRIAEKTHEFVHLPLLTAAALLHDIDKAVPKLPGEHHPDTAVRILREEGMDEVAELVRTHPLHAILDPSLMPKTWEQKILYLADKMVKYDIVSVDERFALWRAEQLPLDAKNILDRSYPKVKLLEKEVFSLLGITARDVGLLALKS
ncbi:HD domain-containing protein [Candidatus Gottesmanbacteria bacterium]|nr:HD domain-containing protein [Candidatus Gottesmanbacteria bacterium]